MVIAIRFAKKDQAELSEVQIPCEDYKQMGDSTVRVSFKSDKGKKPDIETKVKVSGEIKEVVVI